MIDPYYTFYTQKPGFNHAFFTVRIEGIGQKPGCHGRALESGRCGIHGARIWVDGVNPRFRLGYFPSGKSGKHGISTHISRNTLYKWQFSIANTVELPAGISNTYFQNLPEILGEKHFAWPPNNSDNSDNSDAARLLLPWKPGSLERQKDLERLEAERSG